MSRPKIILADIDERYLSSLEVKFMEELGNEVDLEVITEEVYFCEYFSQARQADALVVGEELYSSELQRHNIGNIFVLVEKTEDTAPSAEIIKIFKYSSTKEIYNQVMFSCSRMKKEDSNTVRDTTVVLVYSPQGGVGKTTLALGVSSYFTRSVKRVLYINAERVNTFQYYLNNDAPIPNNLLPELAREDKSLLPRIKHVIRNEGFDYLPPFSAALSSLNISYNVYYKIIQEAKSSKEYDVIVVDTDSTFDNKKAALISAADKVIMVVDQTRKSVFSMNTIMRNMNCTDKDKYFFICNRFNPFQENAIVESDIKPAFMVNDYVGAIQKNNIMMEDIVSNIDIQKISILLE